MSSFNEANLLKKLENVTSSQESIQTLSLWVLHHRNHYKKIVDQWLKCYIKAKSEHRLALFYLANDIVQHAKRKNYGHYLNEFMNVLREAAKVTNDEKIMNNINRVLNIWQERTIYSKEFIQELRELFCGEKMKAEMVSKIISNHSSADVINQINNVIKMEQLTKSKYQCLVNCKIDFANSDLLNKLKDKSYGEQFSKELEDATNCLESTVMAIEKEIASRKALITLLEKSKIFYSIQMKESKNIAETFVNCEMRLKQVQDELKSRGFNLSSLNKVSDINTSQLSSVLNSVFFQQGHNSCVSSLDKRLTILMSGSDRFSLNLDQPSYGPSKSFGLNTIQADFYLNEKKNEVNQIESVITTRSYPNENPSENFEPADMDLGDSDEERQLNFVETDPQKTMASLSFGQEMAKLLPLLPPPPPPPPIPPFKDFLNSPLNETDLSSFRSPIQSVSSIPSVDTNNCHQGDSIRSLSSNRNSHRNSPSYHHQNQWRDNRHNNRNNQSYHYSNNRHGNNRWKNGQGSAGGSWKRTSYDHY